MNIDTVRFSHILEADQLYDLNDFFAHTAFVISHKSERLETLLGVIWYLPINSPILIVTNCSEIEKEALTRELTLRLTHRQVYLIHQKDELVARFFDRQGVQAILGCDGKVRNGKGEGMYIGALFAALLTTPRWLVFYDADNFVPNALLEYTLAMSKLFLQEQSSRLPERADSLYLHNVRICWSSKPSLGSKELTAGLVGRCTRMVSPLMDSLVQTWFGSHHQPIISSNAGEQGFTMETIQRLQFSSGYSVETFQQLDLFSHALSAHNYQSGRVVFQQYQAQSPHFHEKGDEEHIRRMIAESLGCFALFPQLLTPTLEQQLETLYTEMELTPREPIVYPALQTLCINAHELSAQHYRLREPIAFYAGNEQEELCG
ncbi:mannosyl-3-phosphoglycerate synthase [Tengunoibacter tsumagoiensis]|uniref:Mannosyl-3-phosphoglycerate synthase n=1 Tax=Tengunoibacter tsumagoiensis TaxID=2014871 RepID=A0A402A6I0_9CHLR|nr:mannosyl-3-phosphoglycerate synthase [Tengunoibacter tsumagoiensis]GCE14753.1 hypothetical protein KTT_46120 [Tengunoibacter tsumagoiensis]